MRILNSFQYHSSNKTFFLDWLSKTSPIEIHANISTIFNVYIVMLRGAN